MAFDDMFGSGGDASPVEPQSILNDMIAQRMPGVAQSDGAIDPQMVMNRLIRSRFNKQQQDQIQRQQDNANANPDFSSFGKTQEELGPNAAPNGETPDFASFGQTADEQAGKLQPGQTATGTVPVNDTESGPVGAAQAAVSEPIKMTGQTMKMAARGLPAMEQAEEGAFSPLNETLLTNPPKAEDQGLYKAGEATQKFGEELGPSEATQKAHPIATGIGSGVGAVVPGLVLGAIDPIAGVAGTAAMFGASSAEDTYEDAKKHGADDQTASDAALLSGTMNAALGSLPIADVLKPVAKILTPESAGFVVRALARAAENGITFTTVGEAQQYLGAQIAKTYDPKAGYQFDGNRLAAEFLTGSALGFAHAGAEKLFGGQMAEKEPVTPDEEEKKKPDQQTGLPPPGRRDTDTGDQDQTGPGPTPDTGPGTGGGTTETEPPPPFETKLNRGIRDNLEQRAAYYKEFSPDDIASWSDDKLKDYVNTKFGGGSQPKDETAPAGTKDNPIDLKTAADVTRAASMANHEAGETGHATWEGLRATIEVPAGGTRSGEIKGGGKWTSYHPDPYGEFDDLPNAKDGMKPDVIFGPHPSAPTVYVIDELDRKTGQYKQSKSFVGFQTPQDAAKSYLGISSKAPEMIGGMRAFGRQEFVDLARAGGLSKPVSDRMQGGEKPSPQAAPKQPGSSPEATTSPSKGEGVSAEPKDAHKDIEDAVRSTGIHPGAVRPAVIAEAAEIHANEGLSPEDAYQLAVVRGAVRDGLMTPEQVKEQYGNDIFALLEPARTPERGVRSQTSGAAAGGPAAENAGERVRGGSANGGEAQHANAEHPQGEAGQGGAGRGAQGERGAGQPAASGERNAEPNGERAEASTEREPAEAAGGAANLTVPESAATLRLQQKQLVDGDRAVQMFPTGTKELPLPKGMERVETPAGVFHFDPKKIDAEAITKASAAGRENELLGLGPYSKADLLARIKPGEKPVMVTERAPDGTEVRAAAGTEQTAAEQVAALENGKSKGNTVQVEPIERVLNERIAEQKSPKAAGAPLIGEKVPGIKEHKVTAADGTSIKVAPVVVEAKDLITSRDEGYDKDLQPRQRERAASEAQIRDIASNLDPERLGYSSEADRGAPIVGPDGMVESGNGRVMALRRIYEGNPQAAKSYKAWLKEQGVDIAKFKEPVLVRQRVTDLNPQERQTFTVSANQAATLSMSAPERALADAQHISPNMLDLLSDGDLNNLENRKFIRSFVGELPASERGALTSKEGGLSAEGLTRVKNAVLAKAYGDPDIISRITESTDDDVKSLSNALVATAPAWAKLRGEIDAGRVRQDLDLTGELMEAVKRTADIRSKGMKYADYLAQQDAFDHVNEGVKGFMDLFHDARTGRAVSGQKIAEALRTYTDQARKITNDPDLGLDLPKVTAHDIQRLANEKAAQGAAARARPNPENERPEEGGPRAGKGGPGNAAEQLRGSRSRHGLGEPERRFGSDLFNAEPGADNRPQFVIPGTERVSSAELAKRRASERLKPKVAQKPPDIGLFSDEGAQGDLVDLARATSPKPKTTSEKPKATSQNEAPETGPSDSGLEEGARAAPRQHGIPAEAREPIAEYKSAEQIKRHRDYDAAKSGDANAAVRVARDLVSDKNVQAAKSRFGSDVVYAPVLAEEATGRNKLPLAIAHRYAAGTGARVTDGIIQTNKAYHTGAGPMERLAVRAAFDGDVEPGKRYVLVDDTSVMGSTLADLADHIQRNGGKVAGVVLLAHAGRSPILTPTKAAIRDIERRHGDATKDLFGIAPSGLTADEAAYLRNFRNADELGASLAKARNARRERLNAKGLQPGENVEPRAQQPPDENGAHEGAVSVSGPGPAQAEGWAASHTDLGPYEAKPGIPLGRQAQQYVVGRGRQLGAEHILAFNDKGEAIAHGYGGPRNTGMTPRLEAALLDPKQAIVLHHNHPANSGLGDTDLSILATPGVHGIWAHGHEGTVARASLAPAARKALANESMDDGVRRLHWIAFSIGRDFFPILNRAVQAGRLTPAQAHLLQTHMTALALERAGIIDYRSNVEWPESVNQRAVDPLIQRAAGFSAGRLFNGRFAEAFADRQPEPLRHPGDLGTLLERPQELARRYAAQERDDRERRANDRAQEGAWGQVGFAESEPVAPPFYSAAARAIENAKQEKAAPNSWLGMLRNTPGVKPEEMQWLGLEDWLKQHNGPVTRTEIADYVRAHQIEVQEVEKGAAPSPMTSDQRERLEQLEDYIRQAGVENVSAPVMQEFEQLDALAPRNGNRGGTKYATYALPGGKNYRELLLTLPPKQTGFAGLTFDQIAKRMGYSGWHSSLTPEQKARVEQAYDAQPYGPTNREERPEVGPEPYKSTHWDEPNVLAHVRFDDRSTPAHGFAIRNRRSGNRSKVFATRADAQAMFDALPASVRDNAEIVDSAINKRTLHIAEIQSDWHQAGRKKGYTAGDARARADAAQAEADSMRPAVYDALKRNDFLGFDTAGQAMAAIARDGPGHWEFDNPADKELAQRFFDARQRQFAAGREYGNGVVPDAPFKTTWQELALKRMIRYAAENGYDRLSWDTGETNAERYDLSKSVQKIDVAPRTDAASGQHTRVAQIKLTDGHVLELGIDAHGIVDNVPYGGGMRGDFVGKPLADILGKDIADKIMSSDRQTLSGLDLKVGGEGMRGFYDKILPTAATKLTKKFGAKVGKSSIKTLDQTNRDVPFTVRDRDGIVVETDIQDENYAADRAREIGGSYGFDETAGETKTVPVHTLDITPQLRDAAVHQGFSLFEEANPFERTGAGGGGGREPPSNQGTAATASPPPEDRGPLGLRALRNRIADLLGSDTAIKLQEGMSDYSHRMRLLQNDVESLRHEWIAADGRLPDEHQFYVLKRLFPGKRAARVDVFNRQHFDPLVKFLRQNGITEKAAGDYLYAKHAIERNAALARYYAQGDLADRDHQFARAARDPDVVGASGMSANQAREIMRAAESGPKADAFRELVRRVADIRRFVQEEMLRGGLVSRETLADWNRAYDNYVPLKEWDDPEERPENAVSGNGRGRGDVRGPENKTAFGRRSKADNPLAHLIAQAYRTIDRAERNRIFNAMANALGTLKAARAPIEGALGIHLNKGRPQKEVDPNTGLVRTVDSAMDRFGDNAVQFKRNGEPRYFVFDDRQMADAVRRWSPAALPGPLHALLWVMNKMKSLWTHYSPNFLVRHNARYYVESVLNAAELKETGRHSMVTHARQAFPVIGNATRAIFAVERGDDPAKASREMADLMRSYALMKEHGGAMAMRTMRDIDQIKEDLRVRLNKLGRARSNPIEVWQSGVEAMNEISSVWDNAQRLATFHSALKQGMSPQQAALKARDATIDYQFRGLWSNIIGLWEPFFNTALRTGFRLGGAVSRSSIMRGIFFGTLAMGLAASAWNYFVGGNDKDGIPFFDKIPPWERSKSLIILAPWLPDKKGRPSAIKFPFPYNWAAPLASGYALGNFMWGSEKATDVLKELVLKPWISTFSQIGEEGIGVRSIIPEILRPEYDIARNRDWTDRPIHTDEKYQKGPNAYSGKGDYGGRVRTGEGWKYIAETLNDYSGGNRHKSGLFDFYPEDLREVLNPFVGTQIGFGNEVAKTGKSIMAGETPEPTTVPIGRVFFGQDYDAANRSLAFKRSQAARQPWTR